MCLPIEKVKATVQNLSKTQNIEELETDSKLTNIKDNEAIPKQIDLTESSTNKEDLESFLIAKNSLEKILTTTKSIQKINNWC